MWLKYDMEEKWLWSCVKIFVEQEELLWAFGHFSVENSYSYIIFVFYIFVWSGL